MDTKTVVLASNNKGKIAELATHLQEFGLNVVGLEAFPEIPEVEETGVTFEENALLKACTIARLTGLVAVADDSGLEVDALNGAPGVYSARYAAGDDSILPNKPEAGKDERNNAKLLIALEGLPQEQRTARFRCTMAVAKPVALLEGSNEHIKEYATEHMTTTGAWEGTIATAPQGENGFGYDPLFVDSISGRHAAELTKAEKHERSHRGKALAAMLASWNDFIK
ncbi:MAG: RdgB/HAM1 family non-canonical purine NTP pyrophosphatase [Pseudomonadota bacterium]